MFIWWLGGGWVIPNPSNSTGLECKLGGFLKERRELGTFLGKNDLQEFGTGVERTKRGGATRPEIRLKSMGWVST